MPRGKLTAPLEERFLCRTIDTANGCRLWTGGTFTNGYGQLTMIEWNTRYAHQWACHHWNGSPLPIEKGMCVKHSCDDRRCVQPAHLSYGSVQDNIAEMVERNPKAMGRTEPTQQELDLLHEMVAAGTPRRAMVRRIGHARTWIDRVLRDHPVA